MRCMRWRKLSSGLALLALAAAALADVPPANATKPTSAATRAAARAPDPAAIEAALRQGQPAAGQALQTHFSCELPPGRAYAGIASGDARWLAVAQAALQHSDACRTEGIQSALGKAMRRAPQRVLALVDSSPLLAADRICLPFISDELSPDKIRRELAASRRAVAGVRDGALALQRQACLTFIDGVQARLMTPR